MFNEKLARRNSQPKRPLMDAIDLSAESEGGAINFFRSQEINPTIVGRRLSRERREAHANATTAQFKATRHIIRVTAEIARNIIVKTA